jgi:hypothetical protein
MQLRVARLCLDCDEIHDGQQCPICASESFAYLSRWVATPQRHVSARVPQPAAAAATARKSRRVIGYGVVGLGIVGLTRWLTLGRNRIEESALRNPGDLR